MYVGSLGTSRTDTSYLLSSIKATSSTSDTDDTSGASSASGASSTSAASVDVSGPGKLYAKLEELQKTDPAKFKEVVSDIATKLKAAADSSGDKHLSELAAKFQDVANGGDLSQIKPPSPPQNGANGVAAAYAQTGQMGGTPPSGPPPDGAAGSHASASTMKSLFASINDEIDSALSGVTTS